MGAWAPVAERRTVGEASTLSTTLLRLQELDSELDAIGHRRQHLEERKAMAAASALANETAEAHRRCASEMSTLRSQLKDLESTAGDLQARIAVVKKRMFSSNVAARELSLLDEESSSLEKRLSEIEDAELEAMEALDQAEASYKLARERAEAASVELTTAEVALGQAEAILDQEALAVASGRPEVVASLPEAVVMRYESLRAHLGGVAVAKLEGRRCGGCHLELALAEFEAMRRSSPDALLTCESCGRILLV